MGHGLHSRVGRDAGYHVEFKQSILLSTLQLGDEAYGVSIRENIERTGRGVLAALLSAITVVLSGTGLYALMSFTVSERTRESGFAVRSAGSL